MATIITMIVAGLIGIVTTSFGYGWVKEGAFFLPGAALNLTLVILETFIIRSALDKKD